MPCDQMPRGVYGVLLNFHGALARLTGAFNSPPYNKPPCAPILYIKPANTWSPPGAAIPVPAGAKIIQSGATIGIVIGRTATRVSEASALDYVSGLVVVNDWCLAHQDYYRPAIKQRCRDGFCSIGSEIVDTGSAHDLLHISIRTYVNGELRREARTGELVRPIPQLIADVSDFMTLMPGDILQIGVAEDPPTAGVGDFVRVEADRIGSIENAVVRGSDGPEGVGP